ncbi:MAG: phage antirepressor [Vibrio sp.]
MKKENAQLGAQSNQLEQYNTTNNMDVFNNATFGDLSVITSDDNKPWFIGPEVAEKLGYKNINDALGRFCPKKKLSRDPRLSFSNHFGQRGILLIPESNLYRLTMKSTLAEAETFQDWVCEDVLPSIRAKGSYNLSLPKSRTEALQMMLEQSKMLDHQQAYIEETKQDVEFAQAVSSSKSGVYLEEFAKSVDIGRNKLFEWLRKEKILQSDSLTKYSRTHNMPYQCYINAKYFTVKRSVFNTTHGRERGHTPLLTGKGEIWLAKKLIKAGLITNQAQKPTSNHQQ